LLAASQLLKLSKQHIFSLLQYQMLMITKPTTATLWTTRWRIQKAQQTLNYGTADYTSCIVRSWYWIRS